MTDEIRGWLYGWLGKKKFGLPSYNTVPLTNHDGKMRFRCELRIPGFTCLFSIISMQQSIYAVDACMGNTH